MKHELLFIPMVLLSLLGCSLQAQAQTIVSGRVTDSQTGRPLPHVSITDNGRRIHTVTNDDGEFILKTDQLPSHISVSHIGYKRRRIALSPLADAPQPQPLHIALSPSVMSLQEIIVMADDPEQILRAAISRIGHNYPDRQELSRCFYRETARRGQRFIAVAEAVIDMYKSDYTLSPLHDAVGIIKGRRLMSMKARDTLGVKIQGGPVLPLMADVAKNPDYVLHPDNLAQLRLIMEVSQTIDDRPQYVIRMEPRERQALFPLMLGRLFIDQQTLAFTRAELQLDMRDRHKASELMLVHKPAGLRFQPQELSVTVVYETGEDGRTRMSYLRNVMRFTCHWHRRLFSAPFTTVSEMVVTDPLASGRDARRPRGRQSFGLHERFYDRVEYFNDPDFWADYNIIAPTESLLDAIGKLKKQHR